MASSARLGSEWRDLLRDAELLGFELMGVQGRHPRLYNKDVDRFYVAAWTPSDWRARKNAIAEMERISGRKLPRQKAGKVRHQRCQPTDMHMTTNELVMTNEAERLVGRSEELRTAIGDLAAQGSRFAGAKARPLVLEFERIRTRLQQQFYRSIPPLSP